MHILTEFYSLALPLFLNHNPEPFRSPVHHPADDALLEVDDIDDDDQPPVSILDCGMTGSSAASLRGKAQRRGIVVGRGLTFTLKHLIIKRCFAGCNPPFYSYGSCRTQSWPQ